MIPRAPDNFFTIWYLPKILSRGVKTNNDEYQGKILITNIFSDEYFSGIKKIV